VRTSVWRLRVVVAVHLVGLGIGGLGCRVQTDEASGDTARPPAEQTAASLPRVAADPGLPASRSPLLGLLRLPLPTGSTSTASPVPCRDSATVDLFAEPHAATPIGIVRLDSWCRDALSIDSVRIISRIGRRTRDLPTREIAYEAPAAMVIAEAADGWLRLRLDDSAAAWTMVRDSSAYRPIEALVREGLAYLTADWDGRLASAPDAPLLSPMLGGPIDGRPVTVRDVRQLGGVTWVRVDVLVRSACEDGGTPAVVASGWLPLHTATGAPTVWFHSRGC
jgi:hypothetical protein